MVTQADTDHIMKFPILVGDIGGTNARFAILVDAYADPKEFPVLQTADYPTIDEAIQNAILDHTSIQPRSAVLAIAGPVEGDEIDLTNCAWVVKPHQMMDTLGLRDITVLNDFEAQALAVVSLEPKHLEKLGGGAGDPHGSRAVLGPGTGLGVAGMVRARNSWCLSPVKAVMWIWVRALPGISKSFRISNISRAAFPANSCFAAVACRTSIAPSAR